MAGLCRACSLSRSGSLSGYNQGLEAVPVPVISAVPRPCLSARSAVCPRPKLRSYPRRSRLNVTAASEHHTTKGGAGVVSSVKNSWSKFVGVGPQKISAECGAQPHNPGHSGVPVWQACMDFAVKALLVFVVLPAVIPYVSEDRVLTWISHIFSSVHTSLYAPLQGFGNMSCLVC
jgi:hypothetical protein